MKDWKTWAIFLLAGIVLYQSVVLHDLESLYKLGMDLRRQEIDKVSADALKTRLENSAIHMIQMNCAQVETTLKQWNACVIKGINGTNH